PGSPISDWAGWASRSGSRIPTWTLSATGSRAAGNWPPRAACSKPAAAEIRRSSFGNLGYFPVHPSLSPIPCLALAGMANGESMGQKISPAEPAEDPGIATAEQGVVLLD